MAELLDELDRCVLTEDVPEENLSAGDLGTIVMVHRSGEGNYTGPDGYEAEFTYLNGGTRAVASLTPEQVRRTKDDEVARATPAKA